MKIVIMGREINLVDRDVRLAKKLVRKFLKVTKEKAEGNGAPTFYITLLTVMFLMSHDLLSSMSPDLISMLLNAAYKNNEQFDKN